MRVGILGGSFDPIHHGHLVVAQVLLERLGLDAVRLVPAREQPFKVGRHHATAADRLAMVELAVAGAPGLVADRQEVERAGPSYTVDTLRALAGVHRDWDLCLLLGADTAALFGKWREPDAIRALARVVVFSRAGERPPGEVADRVVEVPRIDISSTAVRQRVRLGRPIRYWVPDGVARYIAAQGLYREA